MESHPNNQQKTKLMRFSLFIFQLLVTSIVTFLIASALHTQSVLSGLISVGAEIPLSIRIQTIFVDFIGLLPIYGAVVLLGMLIAMSVAVLITKTLLAKPLKNKLHEQRQSQEPRIWLYASAGAVAIFTILAAMHPILNVSIIAGARELSGLLTQSIAGAIGGAVFGLLRSRLNKHG